LLRTRVIPVLTVRDQGIYRTTQFKRPVYVGDPVVALRIFNQKEVDEMIVLDISETDGWRPSQVQLFAEMAGEAFMPMCYGGKIRSVAQAKQMLTLGYEKVAVNTAAVENPTLVREIAERLGSQAVVVSIDVRRSWRGRYLVWTHLGRRKTALHPVEHAQRMVAMGAGEILITAIDRDGTRSGYDAELVRQVAAAVEVPVIAMGGAGHVDHLRQAVAEGGASAVAAGTAFCMTGRHKAVLITYPTPAELEQIRQ
jgi:cyclase